MRTKTPMTRTALLTLLTAGALSLGGIGVATAADGQGQPGDTGTTGDTTTMEEGQGQGPQTNGQTEGGFGEDEQPEPGTPETGDEDEEDTTW